MLKGSRKEGNEEEEDGELVPFAVDTGTKIMPSSVKKVGVGGG